MKRGSLLPSWSKHWVVLQQSTGTLQFFETRDATTPSSHIEIDASTVCRFSERNTLGSGCAFEVLTAQRSVHLVADSVEQMQLWVQAISNCKLMRWGEDDDVIIDQRAVDHSSDVRQRFELVDDAASDAADDGEPVWGTDWGNDAFDSEGELEVVPPPPPPPPAPPALPEPAPAPQPAVTRTITFVQFHKRRPEWSSFKQRSEQMRAFVAWSNHWLATARSERRVDADLDVRSGETLCELLRFFLAREGLPFDDDDASAGDDAALQRLRRFFKAFRDSRFAARAYLPPTLNAAAVVQGNISVVLDTLWALFVAFDLADGVDALLQWHAAAMALPAPHDDASLPLAVLLNGDRLLSLMMPSGNETPPLLEKRRAAFQIAASELGVAAFLDDDEQGENDAAATIIWLAWLRRAVRGRVIEKHQKV